MGRRKKEQAERKEIRALLKDKRFIIPSYQRFYSWKKQQRRDFFEDLDTNIREHSRNFLSMVVVVDYGETEKVSYIDDSYQKSNVDIGIVELVDGQQRLTTITILIKAIAEFYKKNISDDNDFEKRANHLDSLLVKRTSQKQSLVINQENSASNNIIIDYFLENKKNSKVSTIAGQRVIEAIDECRNYVEFEDYYGERAIKREQSKVVAIEEALLNRCYVILFTLKEKNEVYQVFESLNSRGLPIAAIDNMKSRIMSVAYEMEDKDSSNQIEKIWGDIYSTIGTQKIVEDDILSIAASLYKAEDDDSLRPKSVGDAMEYFSNVCAEKIKFDNIPKRLKQSNEINDTRGSRCLKVSELLLDVTKLMVEVSKNKTLDALTDIKQARVLLIAIKMSERSSVDKQKLIDAWCKTTFRLFSLHRKDARSFIRDYMECAELSLNMDKETDDVLHYIREIGEEYTFDEGIENVKGSQWYSGYSNDIIYILREYDGYLARKKGIEINEHLWADIWSKDPSKTIEHIFPETLPKSEEKQDVFKSNWPKGKGKRYRNFSQDNLNEFTHNIGNLTLLSQKLNSEAGQRPYKEKAKLYEKTPLNIHPGLKSKYLMSGLWTEESIIKREKDILAFIKENWG